MTRVGPLTRGRRHSSSTEATIMPAMRVLTILELLESTLPVHWDEPLAAHQHHIKIDKFHFELGSGPLRGWQLEYPAHEGGD